MEGNDNSAAKSVGLVDKALTVYQKGSQPASWVFGSIILLVLIVMFFLVPNPTEFQRGLARFFVALSAGFLAFFLVGGVLLSGGWGGITIGAAGGFAVFVGIQFFFDPFPAGKVGPEALLKEWKGGQRLGSLVETLRGKALTSEVEERILVDPAKKVEIENLRTTFLQVTGKTWAEVFEKICDFHSCLRCQISADKKTIGLSLSGEVVKRCEDADCQNFTFACK